MLTLTVEAGPGMFDTILRDAYELAKKLSVAVRFEANDKIWYVYPGGHGSSVPKNGGLADLEEWEPIPGDLTGRWRKVSK